jgi:hypothetical protein
VKGQLSRLVGGLRGQGVEQFGRSEAFVSSPDSPLFLLDHVHEFDPNECVLGCLERFEPQHRPCHPLDTSMILLNGLITNDKFCLTRQSQIKLQWSRKPYRFRPRKSAYALDEPSHQGAYHEAPVADTSSVSDHGRRRTAMGPSLPNAPTMEPIDRVHHQARPFHNSPSSFGGNV